VGGAFFGALFGGLHVIIGATIGATIAFIIARYFMHDWVHDNLIMKNKKLEKYNRLLGNKKGISILLILRFLPIVPFNALNYALGVTNTKLSTYIWTTLVGIIPGVFIYTFFGGALGSMNPSKIIVGVLVLLLFTILVTVVSRLFKKHDENEYDIAVIGAGSADLNIAVFMNRIGLRVLMIDKSDKDIGGDCLNYGCIPSKSLIHVAKLVKGISDSSPFLKNKNESEIVADLGKVSEYVKSKIEKFRPHENAEYFRKQGIEVVLGEAKFIDDTSLFINEKEYSFSKCVIATGSKPFVPSIKGIEKVEYLTNESIFDLSNLPEKMVVIGGGPIGREIGQAFSRLGSSITIINNTDYLVSKEDTDVSNMLQKNFEGEGIVIKTNTEVIEFKDFNTLITNNGEEIKFDKVFIATGRKLNIDNLDLDEAGVDMSDDRRKIIIDKKLRTSNKRIFLCGDVAGMHQFTHAAEHHAGLLIKNFFSPKKSNINNDHLAWVTYTSPEIGTFGLSMNQLDDRGIKYEVLKESFDHDDRAITDSYEGLVKLYISPKGVLLGGTMIAPGAGELIQELILAQTHKMNVSKLFAKNYPYPTATRINKRVIGGYMGRKITPFTKKIFKMLFS
jgi:pyruvate/2-oxoglutarate dehydrogenase complex dihydrolipoamide dehydrogenase (E3) component/membrane protein YqaA with SNARE-associated domain